MNTLVGAYFEIVSTNKIPPVRRIISCPPTFSLLLSWQASPIAKVRSEAANHVVSRPGTETAHLSDPEGSVGELGGDASSPPSACIAFQDWRASAKPVLILAGEISSTFVPPSRDFTVSKFVHDLEVWY